MNLLEKYRSLLNDASPNIDNMTTLIKDLTDEELFIYEERAGIMEFDGGLPRKDAENKALSVMTEMRVVNKVYEVPTQK